MSNGLPTLRNIRDDIAWVIARKNLLTIPSDSQLQAAKPKAEKLIATIMYLLMNRDRAVKESDGGSPTNRDEQAELDYDTISFVNEARYASVGYLNLSQLIANMRTFANDTAHIHKMLETPQTKIDGELADSMKRINVLGLDAPIPNVTTVSHQNSVKPVQGTSRPTVP